MSGGDFPHSPIWRPVNMNGYCRRSPSVEYRLNILDALERKHSHSSKIAMSGHPANPSPNTRELCNNHAIALNTEDNSNRRTFFWGVVLAWTPIALFVLGIVRAMLEISSQRTSGLGAVAGGLSEVLITYGLLVALASQILAVVLLVRAFTSQQSLKRKFFSAISICCACLVLLLCGVVLSKVMFWRI